MAKKKQVPDSQLSLFDNTVSKHWEEIRKVEVNGEMFYSILDIFKFFGDSSNPTMAWKQTYERMIKQGFEGSNDLLEHAFEGKGQRQTPIANRTAFFRIAQSTNFKHWEEIRMFMAEAAKEKVESQPQTKMRQTIEYYEAVGWGNRPEIMTLKSRYDASVTLGELKDCISKLLSLTGKEWANFHSTEIQVLLGLTITQLKNARDPKKSARENLNALELNALTHAERDLMYILSIQGNVDSQRLMDNVRIVFTPIGENLQRTLNFIGVSALTGFPVLKSKN